MSLWDNWGDERVCDEGHWQAHTRGLPWSLPEVVGTIEQVHCGRRRLLRRGLEFHVCTINKVPIGKKSGNLFNDHRSVLHLHYGVFNVTRPRFEVSHTVSISSDGNNDLGLVFQTKYLRLFRRALERAKCIR